MLKSLLKFELGFHARQIGFWVVMVVMIGYGLLVALLPDFFGSGLTGARLKANGAQTIASGLSAAFLPVIFFGGIFTVLGVLRDKTSNMLEIVHATPVQTRDMTLARIVGIFSIVCLALFVFLVAQFAGSFSKTLDPATIGPIRPLYYLQPFLIFTVVNALFVTAFFTLIAGLTQDRVLVLVSAIGLFFVTMMTGVTSALDAPKWIQALADPFGSIAYELDVRDWNPTERNTRLLPLTGYTGLNRLVWGMISLGILAAIFGKFKRGLVRDRARKQAKALNGTGLAYASTPQRQGFGSDLTTLWSRFKLEYTMTVRSVPFIVLASLAAALFSIIIVVSVFFSPQKLIPTSMSMSSISFVSLLFPMLLIISFFAGEITFRDRGAKFNELLDGTQSKNWTLMVAKWLALLAIVATLCLMAMTIGMIIQFVSDSPPVDIGIYLRRTVFNIMPNYLMLAALAMFMQIFAPNRIVGMLLAAMSIAVVLFGIGNLPFYHPLMGFGASSPGAVSEISPYSNWIRFRWFNFYWTMFIVMLGVLSVWTWRRGLQTGLLHRLGNIGRNVSLSSGAVLGLALAGFIGSGLYIKQAYDKTDWSNQSARENRQVAGEKLFKAELDYPIPHIRSVELDAELFPRRQEAVIKGVMALENASGEPITELYVRPPTSHAEDMRVLDITGARRVTEGQNLDGDDVSDFFKDYYVWLYRFEPPLAPGAKATVTYEHFFHAPRLADRSVINKNGTFLNNYSIGGLAPRFGPPSDLAIQNEDKRRKLGLEPLPKWPEPVVEGTDLNIFGTLTGPADLIDFEGRVCTDAPQIPIAPGNLVSEETKDGRTCRVYATSQPISNFFSVLSGEYAVTEDSWTDPNGKIIPIRVYHAKNHDYSVGDMIKGVQFGLEHFTEHFGPYPYDYVRIMEVPFIGFAQAFAGTIPFAEQGFIMDAGDPEDVKTLDNATATTMHEMGHQWFAHQIVPGFSRGFNVLSEGLTSYATLDAYEALYGYDKARYMLENGTIGTYQALSMFDSQEEVPLKMTRNQGYLFYQKADWALWSLKYHIGPQKMRDAMRGFLDDWGLKGPPYPTTGTLLDVLREAAGPEYDQLITDQWERVVWWKYKFEDGPTVRETSDGKWEVTFTVDVEKSIKTEEMEDTKDWNEVEGEVLNEHLEIGFYTDEPKQMWSQWTRLEKVRITQSDQAFTFVLDDKPSHIALDPRRLAFEINVEDNVRAVGEASAMAR